MKKLRETRAAESKRDDSEYELSCVHCTQYACISHDIVCIKTMHVVKSKAFRKRIEIVKGDKRTVELDDSAAEVTDGIMICKKCKEQWGN
ncbi:hypothetical protein, partial [Salmonella sp. s51944]|uniref:hypothetical protein n=1 Tax=Salmonella sp. s51944 TaxID=3159655 RepID=UPI0039801AC2